MASARDLTALPGCDESKAATQDAIDQVDTAHSSGMSLKQQSLSDLFTIVSAPSRPSHARLFSLSPNSRFKLANES